MTEAKIPDFARESLQKLSQYQGLGYDVIKKEALELFTSDLVAKDIQFPTDDAKWRYTLAVVHNRYARRLSVRQYMVCLVGFDGVRITQKGKKMSSIFAITKRRPDEKEPKLRRIVCQDKFAELYKKITPYTTYNPVELTQFKGGDLGIDDRAKFENPTGLFKAEDLLEKMEKLGWVKRITCAETLTNPSKKQPNSKYIDLLDWKVVRAVIQNKGTGKREDGTEYAYYHVGDFSTRENGAPFGLLTVWIPPELMVQDENSECDFVGTVTVDKEGLTTSMNAYMIVPVHTVPKATDIVKETN